MSKALNLTKTAKHLGIHKRKLYRMIKDGSFDAEPIKGTNPRLWNVATLDKWLDRK